MGGLQKFQPTIVFFTLSILVLVLACGVPSPTESTAIPQSFIYQVNVESAVTGKEILDAEIIIQVANRSPLTAITDHNGYARISVDASYAKEPARLVINAQGFRKFRQEINLNRERLPDIIKLEPLSPAANLPNQPTEEPTTETITPTASPSEGPTQAASTPPTPTGTSIPAVDTPTSTSLPPTATPTSTPTNIPASAKIEGKIALPLSGKIYIANTDGTMLGHLEMARQPAYSNDGAKLIVNGDNGPLDKLRLSGPTGENAREIGDSGLGGHSHPVWSPDSEQVMYDDHTIGGEIWRIFRRHVNDTSNGPGEEIIAAAGPIVGQNPMWTTGERFVFRGCKTWTGDAGECGLWVMQGNRGNPIRLSNNLNQIPTDIYGDTLVYVSNDGNDDWNIYTMNISNEETQQLTSNPAADGLATISPDGQTVAFLSNRGGVLAVWYVSIQGGTPTKMFDIPSNWGTLRADGWSEEKLSWGQ